MATRRRLSARIEDSPEDDGLPIDIPPEYRHLDYTATSKSVREFWSEYLSGYLILDPDFQRNYVWDSARASRFIESLLLNMPSPHIFLGEEDDGSLMVIDGHQRLETIFKYLQPLLRRGTSNPGSPAAVIPALTPLSLRNLNVLSELSGKRVTALRIEDRQRLWDTTLPVIILLKENHPDLKYELFSRLNQGSMSLTNQELRNCIYRGPYNRMIAHLSENREFLHLWNRNQPDKRMRTRELILRFFALLHRRDRYRTPFREFLNEEMRENRYTAREAFLREFDAAVKWVERVFGREAFRLFGIGNESNPSGTWGRRRYDLIYELEMVAFAELADALDECWESLAVGRREIFVTAIRRSLIDVMTRDRFRDALRISTASHHALNVRFESWLGALRQVVANPEGAILDSSEVIEQLGKDVFCGVCRGVLTRENALWKLIDGEDEPVLVHRFCERI